MDIAKHGVSGQGTGTMIRARRALWRSDDAPPVARASFEPISHDDATSGGRLPALASDFPAFIDLANLDGENGFRIEGIREQDISGRSVSSAGDVNSDGFDDLVIGARLSGPEGLYAGETYVVFGGDDGFPASLNLAQLSGSNGFRIAARGTEDRSGYSVSGAGDVNGDGFDDIIIGAPNANFGGDAYVGECYIVFGKSGQFADAIELASLDGTSGFRLEGIDALDRCGFSVSGAGDINGDGYDDVVIGAVGGDPGGREYAGESYVVFGKSDPFPVSVDLATLDGANGFRIDGVEEGDVAGQSVSSAGDINGDGFSDLVVGARGADPDDIYNAGISYVVFGTDAPFTASLDLSALDGSNGFRLNGANPIDESGFSVASAGDINGDGFDDLVLGAPGVDTNGQYTGEGYIVFGQAGGFAASLDLTDLDGSNGFRVQGVDEYDSAGVAVSGAGDVNGDGFEDVLIGARGADANALAGAGETYLIFGGAGGFDATLAVTDLDGSNGFRLGGGDAYGQSGSAVSSAGDINGDGFDDIVIGAPNNSPGGRNFAGESYVIFGRAPSEPADRTGSVADQAIRGGAFNDTLSGEGGDDTLGGGSGADWLNGGGGLDWADYAFSADKVLADLRAPHRNTNEAAGDSYISIENLRGSSRNDALFGDDGRNRIEGLARDDLLNGREGNDTLAGGAGCDRLKGGEGSDRFELASLDADDADKMLDFGSGEDRIALDGDVFGLSRVKPSAFVVGGAATDANDRLIYDAAAGKLFFDADGTGAEAQVLIARLTGAPALAAGDFVVI